MQNLRDYIQAGGRGAAARLAADIGASSVLISQWTKEGDERRPIPVERCAAIERATEGAVPCECMRTDVMWTRIADSAWPWHPNGRPVIEVTATAETERAGVA